MSNQAIAREDTCDASELRSALTQRSCVTVQGIECDIQIVRQREIEREHTFGSTISIALQLG